MKKLICVVLALVMALSFATTAWGATTVTDEDGLKTAIAAGGEIELGANIALTGKITVANDVTIRAAAPGYTIDASGIANDDAFKVTGKLTLGENVTVYSTGGAIVEVDGGTLDINGATVYSNGVNGAKDYAAIFAKNGGTVNVLDGSVYNLGTDKVVISTKGGTINVSGGEVYSDESSALAIGGTNGGAINISDDAHVYTNATNADSSEAGRGIAAVFGYSGTITVTGGTIENRGYPNSSGALAASSETSASTTSATVIVSGGNVQSVAYRNAATADDITITGGTFSDVASAEPFLADGLTFVGNTVGTLEKNSTSYEGLFARTADMSSAAPTIAGIDIIVTPAKAPKYNKTTGMLEQPGEVEHVNITGWGGDYVFVNSTDEADVVLYKDAEGKQIRFRLALVNTPVYAEGVKFTNFGDKCGEVDYDDYDKDDVYFTAKGDVNEGIYVADKNGLLNVMYGNKLVAVMPIGLTYTDDAVQHTPVMTNKNGKTVAVECGACGLDAVEVANVLSLPKGAEQIDTLSGVWYWPTATVVTPSTDKTVESAETFDAGIAMYVGMSVMAAAGSAVVLKKKD